MSGCLNRVLGFRGFRVSGSGGFLRYGIASGKVFIVMVSISTIKPNRCRAGALYALANIRQHTPHSLQPSKPRKMGV